MQHISTERFSSSFLSLSLSLCLSLSLTACMRVFVCACVCVCVCERERERENKCDYIVCHSLCACVNTGSRFGARPDDPNEMKLGETVL